MNCYSFPSHDAIRSYLSAHPNMGDSGSQRRIIEAAATVFANTARSSVQVQIEAMQVVRNNTQLSDLPRQIIYLDLVAALTDCARENKLEGTVLSKL